MVQTAEDFLSLWFLDFHICVNYSGATQSTPVYFKAAANARVENGKTWAAGQR